MLTPRFAVDTRGKFAVSHSPFLIVKGDDEEMTLLKFFCALLNSSVGHWYLSTHAPKYGGGYNRVEVSLLRGMPVPNPADVHPSVLRELIEIVDKAGRDDFSQTENQKLERIVADLYNLSPVERRIFLGEA
jgi:hypothetical protein